MPFIAPCSGAEGVVGTFMLLTICPFLQTIMSVNVPPISTDTITPSSALVPMIHSMSYQFGNAFIGGPAPYASDLLGGIYYFLYPVFTLAFILVAFGTIATMKETSKVNIGESAAST